MNMRLRRRQSGFTLLELVMVMFMIALIAGILAPAMLRFTAGRAVDNFGRQIIAVAQRARGQSIIEGRAYRINFDQSAGQIWVTADTGGGNFQSPGGELNQRYSAPEGVKLEVAAATDAPPAPVILLPWPTNFQPQSYTQPMQLLDGTPAGTGSIWTFPQTATFVQFQPTGRTDPATIVLSDNSGHSMRISCASPTDTFQEVTR